MCGFGTFRPREVGSGREAIQLSALRGQLDSRATLLTARTVLLSRLVQRGRRGPAVLLVGKEGDWPPELKAGLHGGGYISGSVAELSLVPSLLAEGRVRALFVFARPLGASDLLVLRRVREASPRTAIVVVTRTPTDPDLKRAFESGATAFLSWPASGDALRQAVESGDLSGGDRA